MFRVLIIENFNQLFFQALGWQKYIQNNFKTRNGVSISKWKILTHQLPQKKSKVEQLAGIRISEIKRENFDTH